jgi:large subunit ribosomal protein L31
LGLNQENRRLEVKKGIHPEYKETVIACACWNMIHTRSTKQNIHVEICSKCHPFYTGKQKLVDSAGMVDRFKKRYADKKKAA